MRKFIKYIMRHSAITSIIGVVVIISVYLCYDWYDYDYNIRDFFSDSNSQGKMIFMFIEVDEYDKLNMIKIGRELIKSHPAASMKDKGKLLIMISHFYKQSETKKLPDSIKKDILGRYNYLERIDRQVNFIPRGYIYTAFSRKVKGVKIPQDSLFLTSFIVPKPGVKARDVIRKSIGL